MKKFLRGLGRVLTWPFRILARSTRAVFNLIADLVEALIEGAVK